jgi:hypothetical protein
MRGAARPTAVIAACASAISVGVVRQQALNNAVGDAIGCPFHHSSNVSMRAGPMPAFVITSLTSAPPRSSTLCVLNSMNGHEFASTSRALSFAIRSIVRPSWMATTSDTTEMKTALSARVMSSHGRPV